jgi:hypothetical protein
MISPDWCRMMAAYNSEMNRRLYDAAGQLPDAARREDRGAWFGSWSCPGKMESRCICLMRQLRTCKDFGSQALSVAVLDCKSH